MWKDLHTIKHLPALDELKAKPVAEVTGEQVFAIIKANYTKAEYDEVYQEIKSHYRGLDIIEEGKRFAASFTYTGQLGYYLDDADALIARHYSI